MELEQQQQKQRLSQEAKRSHSGDASELGGLEMEEEEEEQAVFRDQDEPDLGSEQVSD